MVILSTVTPSTELAILLLARMALMLVTTASATVVDVVRMLVATMTEPAVMLRLIADARTFERD